MKSNFAPEFFVRNRKELLKKTKSKILVIPAHQVMQRNCDNTYAFRQESNFWYLTGLNEPDCILVVSNDAEFLIIPKKDWVEAVFDGEMSLEQYSAVSGVKNVFYEQEGWSELTKLLQRHKKVGVLLPMRQRHFKIATNPARAQLIAKMRRKVKSLELEDVRLVLSRMRMVKQPEEVRTLQEAIDITNDTLLEVFKPGWDKIYRTEYELEAAITAGFRRRGATGHGFTPIVANGKKTCMIHPVDNGDDLKKGSLLLVDLGAEVNNYTADISRTIPIGGAFTERQRQVFDAVNDVCSYARSLLKPGQNYMEYENLVEKYMGTKLQELGVIKTATRKNIRQYFPHRTSHSLGLDPHDPADYQSEILENMVLTIEPGIYIPEEGIGIRIEDDILITKKGMKVMSSNLPTILN